MSGDQGCYQLDVDGSPVVVQIDPSIMQPETLEALKEMIRALRRKIDKPDEGR